MESTLDHTATAFQASSKIRLNWDAQLSDTEYKVGEQTILGYTQDEVATIFHRSRFTITNTLRRAFKKTGARNIAELAVWFWCREFKVTMIISEGKRKVISGVMLLLFVVLEFSTLTTDLRAKRSRRSKDEFEFLCESFDFTEPPSIPC